ncbi:signal peptidase II [Lachnospiraceae bacterium YH-ros2228]|nr:signal peptidase II [Lachnospiraceae bacterium]MDD6450804.1 signal peptidase II [Lachnospiraceae bacterium]MDD6579213.1 signal peptidase II [Lachnospiraceae bacterium]
MSEKSLKTLIKMILFILIFTVLTIAFDQWTKALAVTYLKGKEDILLIPGVLQLTYLENTGAAFSFAANHSVFQTIMTVLTPIVMVLILFFVLRSVFLTNKDRYRILRIDLLFILAGALGNYIDRIQNHYVVDFIYFSLINFPVFNVADIYVTLSVIVLFCLFVFYYKEEELSNFFSFRKAD